MYLIRTAACGLSLALLVTTLGSARADEEADKQSKKAEFKERLNTILAERLELTARQKDRIAQLQKEFANKNKAAKEAIKDAVHKAIDDGDRKALKNTREQRKEVGKLRAEYREKALAVLTEEQRSKLPLGGRPLHSTRPADQEKKPSRKPERKPSSTDSELDRKLERLQQELQELRKGIRGRR